jgi:PAS domain S-box-containing protein
VSNQVEELERQVVATSAGSSAPVGKILVVDDEPELRNVLVESLQKHGYEVTGCGSGRTALAELRERDFDLLLTDLMMPEMDGITLLKAALEIDPHLVGVVVTGQGTIQSAVDAMQIGAFDYVLKPFRMQNLMPVLTRALNARQLRLENLQLRETLAIYELTQTISFTLDPQTVMSKLTEAALQQAGADEVSVLLPTSDGTEFYVAAARGDRRERLLGERIPFDRSISSWVARERVPIILNGEVDDDRFVALWPRPAIRSSVSIPMLVANKLIGVLNLNIINRNRPFALGQMKALSILAGTAAAALESASLYVKVRTTEEKYRSIFDNASEGLFQTSVGGQLLMVNPAFARILGYDSTADMLATVKDVAKQIYVNPEDRSEAARLQEEHGTIEGFEFESLRKNGERIWLSLNRRSVRNQSGDVLYFEGSVEDITARRQIEDETRKARQQYESLVHTIDGIVWELDVQSFVFTFVSKQSERILGYTPDQWLNDPNFWTDHLHPDDRVWALKFCRDAASRRTEHEFDYRMIAADGRVVWLRDMVTVDETNDGSPHLRGIMVDITERKVAEDQLKKSEERYRDLVENAHDLIYEHDLEGNYISANKEVQQLTGYSLEESFHLNQTQIVSPEYIETAREMLRRKLTGERVTAYELEIVAKDGHRVPVEVNSSLVLRDGVPVGVRGIARDITARKQAEKALRDSEARKRAILESALDCIITMDHEGLVIDWNPAAERAFGYSCDEAVGKEMAELIIPLRYREQHRGGLARYLATGTARVLGNRLELSAIRADGTEFPVELTITEIELEGNPMFTGYLRDITVRKETESRLAAQYAVTRALSESNTISEGAAKVLQAVCESLGWEYAALWTVDRDSNVLRCSQVWQASGTEGSEFESVSRQSVFAKGVGVPGTVWQDGTPVWIADVVGEPSFPRSAVADKIGLHGGCGFPIRFRAEILGVMEFFSRSIREPDPDLLAMMVTIGSQVGQFIERKRVEQALGQSEEQLRQSQKLEAIGQLAGGVAHDFNNLLTVIGGYSSILLNKFDQDSPFRVSVEEIKKASDRASGLTRQLLAFSRKQILQPKILDLNVVVSDLDKMVRRLIGEDIDLLTLTDPKLGKAKADPGQIEQVLLNLIVNARDAMPDGGKLTIETANATLSDDYALSHAAVSGSYVMLAVSDTGCGMDAELQKHVFEPFFTTKPSGKGTGLGLATVYGIVKQSDGHIWLYSEPGRGTCFKLYLPCIREVVVGQTTDSQRLVPKGTETLLLVEDEDQVRRIVRAILEQQGYEVLTAANGEEALKLAKLHGEGIHMLMTDVVMPQMSGRQLAEELTSIRPELKVLYMSGYTDDAIVRHGLLDASLNFIQKPFDAASVARKVREVLDSEARTPLEM